MIQEFVTIHGRFQFEIKQRLFFGQSGKKNRYVVETLVFIPNSLRINKRTFSKERFYSRLKNYIRLKIPEFYQAPDHAMARVREALERVRQGLCPASHYQDEVKLYALMLKRRLRYQTYRARTLSGKALADLGAEALDEAATGTERLRSHAAEAAPVLDEAARQAVAYCNEYISMCLSYYFFRLLDIPAWEADLPMLARVRHQILARIRSELAYQERFIPEGGPDADNETMIYRWSVLKKYVSSPLFLEIRQKTEGRFLLQLSYGIAAGLAMVFATGIAFIWQDIYGSLSSPLFVALVIGYIFKDRMKEAIRDFLASRLKKVLSDRQQFVYQNFTTLIGKCRENFYFIDESQIPEPVMRLRNKTHLVDIENSFRSENVLYYRKEITMKPRAAGESWDGLVDITRLNISDFLDNMDDPKHTIFDCTGDQIHQAVADKVYHINMIRSHRIGKKRVSRRFRIVLNRDGIKRIEHITAQ